MASRRRAMKDLGRVTFPPASTSGGGSPVTPPRVSLRRIQWRVIEHTVRLAPEAAGGRGRGCAGATTEQSLSHVCTHCAPRQASDPPCLQTAFTSSGRSTSHRAPPGPLSAAQQQQAVRGQGTACAALTCAVRASTRVMATQLTLDYRGGVLQAAHTVPQRRGHGAPKAAPQA